MVKALTRSALKCYNLSSSDCRMRYLLILFLILAGCQTPANHQEGRSMPSIQTDSLTVTNPDRFSGTDDFSPMQLFFVLVLLGVVLLCAGLTLFLLLILFGLVSAGIVSGSFIAGLYTRSVSKGFKTFVLLVCTIAGFISGTFCFFILHRIGHWGTTSSSMISGAVSGVLLGFLFGLWLFYMLKRVMKYFVHKYKLIQRV
jgi:hypothetical protein